MKRYLQILILPIMLFILGCEKDELIDESTLIHKEHQTKYHPITNEQYFGKAYRNYPSGKLHYQCSYEYGKRHGLITYYHENGEKEEEGNFTWGEQDGLWTKWDENGKIRGEARFKNGFGWYEFRHGVKTTKMVNGSLVID
mgnify:CR=1 FL=1